MLMACEKGGVAGWKYGEDGTCYIGKMAKQKAMREKNHNEAKVWQEIPRIKKDKVNKAEVIARQVAKEKFKIKSRNKN